MKYFFWPGWLTSVFKMYNVVEEGGGLDIENVYQDSNTEGESGASGNGN